MQQAETMVATEGKRAMAYPFQPWNTELAVTAHDGTDLIDDASIWIDQALSVVQLMISEVEKGPDNSELLMNQKLMSGNLYALVSMLSMANGLVQSMASKSLIAPQ